MNSQHFLLKALKKGPCALCKTACYSETTLCQHCEPLLPWNTKPCLGCAKPLFKKEMHCGLCIANKLPFDRIIAPLLYEFPIIQFINELKFHRQISRSNILGNLFLKYRYKNKPTLPLPQCIIPVPLHEKRLQQRGFNQSLELARPIAKPLGIPIMLNACHRISNTQPQAKLTAQERKANVKNAFLINECLTLEHIAILDDVITTGHTVTELSRLFKKSGVNRVEVWSIARARFES